MNINEHVLVWIHTFTSLGLISKNELAGLGKYLTMKWLDQIDVCLTFQTEIQCSILIFP